MARMPWQSTWTNRSTRKLRPTHWTGSELAEVLGCSPKLVRKMAAEGALPAIRLGGERGHWRYPIAAVKELIRRGHVKLPSE